MEAHPHASPSTRKSHKWLYMVLPANVAYGPLSTLITLYILHLGGNVINVAYAITLASFVAIPASFFWGQITDMFNKRKTQIIISYIGLALSMALLLSANSILSVSAIYAFATFIVAANAAPLNLLVMERTPTQKWARVFSKLQTVASLGATVGFVLAAVVTTYISLYYLTLILFVISIFSIVMAELYLKELPIRFTIKKIFTNSFAIIGRTIIHPIFVSLVPRPSTIRRLLSRNGTVDPRKRTLSYLYAASFIFYIGSALFNTVYPAGLSDSGLSESAIFIIMFAGIAAQTITFDRYPSLMQRRSRSGTIKRSLALRAIAYALIGVAFFVLKGMDFISANIVLYAITSGLAYSVFYTTWSALVFENIGSTDRGSAIGIYTAISGTGTLIGALLSGYTSFYVGYYSTFGLAAALMFVSLLIYWKGRPPGVHSSWLATSRA